MLAAVTMTQISNEILQISVRILRGLAAAGQRIFAHTGSATLDLLTEQLHILTRKHVLLAHHAKQTLKNNHALIAGMRCNWLVHQSCTSLYYYGEITPNLRVRKGSFKAPAKGPVKGHEIAGAAQARCDQRLAGRIGIALGIQSGEE